MLIPNTADDWQLYYGNTYFKIKEKDKWKWIHAISFERAAAHEFQCAYSLDDTNRYHAMLNTREVNFDLSYPDSHYYFLDGEAMWLHRKPIRSSTKAISIDNCQWVAPIDSAVPRNFQTGARPQTIKRLALGLSDFTFENAKTMTASGKALLVPMKKEWALSLSPKEKFSHLLWYRTMPVALLERDSLHIIEPVFKQEIADNFADKVRVVNHD